jgi:hypothetical protein
MKKFSAGGAQGRYDRRMADIEKDHAKAMARKTGKAAEVAEAKRQQRIADAKDDFAKRTGADRTATRAAERLAEVQLKKTRKYGAPKSVTTEASVSEPKIGNVLAPIKSGLSTPAKKAPAKPAAKPSAADIKRNKFFQDSLAKSNFKAVGDAANARQKAKIGASNAPSDQGFSSKPKTLGASKDLEKGTGTSTPAAKAKADTGPRDNTAAGRRQRMGAALSYLNPFSYISDEANARYAKAQKAKGYAKGGKIMQKKPMPMGGKQLMPLKKKLTKEPITGGSDTVPATSERNEFRKEMMKRNATPGMSKGGKMKKYAAGGVTKEMPSSKAMGSLGMAKGGKAKMKPAAKGKAKGNPFAATKFGAAMMKKSADTEGRAMKKFAKGGSIDGCAVKGKTKTSMVKMARGGSPLMRKRDSYGGAMFKKGGKTC